MNKETAFKQVREWVASSEGRKPLEAAFESVRKLKKEIAKAWTARQTYDYIITEDLCDYV